MSVFERQQIQITTLVGEGWFRYLADAFDRSYMRRILSFLKQRRLQNKVYPSSNNVFKAFKLTPFKDVNVVILGQDPYPDGSGDGLAFSCSASHTPKSLQIIFKEIKRTHVDFNLFRIPELSDWAKQGILLLNTILTVDQGKPGSHANIGWEEFTVDVIKTLNKHPMPLVFVLWGSKARQYDKYIDKNYHLVLESNHPAAEAYGTGNFIGNNHFVLINEFLKKTRNIEIKWQ